MKNYYDETKKFSKKHVAPFSVKTDQEITFPTETFKALGDAGYLGLLVPEKFGGQGKGLQEHAQVVMALAEDNPSAGLCYMMHNVALKCIIDNADETLVKKICEDVINNHVFLALAYSEFGTGVHFYKPELKATKEGQATILNGKKSMVTSATHASYYLVLAPSVEKAGDINNWVVPVDSAGLSFDMPKWNGLGMHGNVSCPMILNNVHMDPLYRIGEEGTGFGQVFTTVATFFLTGLAAVSSGICLALSEQANAHALERKYPGGTSIAEIPAIQEHLAKIYMHAVSAKAMTFEAARAGAEGADDAVTKIFAARIQASEFAIDSATHAMRVGGGWGYNKGLPIERYLRDSFAGQIMAPSVDVLNSWLGKVVTGQQIP
ncbi:acyl-CoA dehydrogenase family protein [Loigolactobacillus iwatensis]|uniref:acyl-CoA dehydrogenase family protein n=1 Tax=Loigolactobacillus iwatensis TaxID=1267156 RepID=UPI000F7F8180|nr:acyl-CoA dehydrogenase family protein [Loigolactobacillus iwatensis]